MVSEDSKLLNLINIKNLIKHRECIIEKIQGCRNNLKNSSTTKVREHIFQVFQSLQYLHLEA